MWRDYNNIAEKSPTRGRRPLY